MTELLIAEKPDAAFKIATALADDKVVKKNNKKVPYYEITHKGKKIVVGCAVGHLFGLKEVDGKGWVYPTFNYGWVPTYEINKGAKYTKDYIETLKKLAKEAENYYNFCDVDTEGELIFRNILRFICKKENAKRAYFSTLTKKDLLKAFETAKNTINLGLAEAGETRHILDWLHGINLSRALTLAMKSAQGGFKVLSIGRVQGPTLNLIVQKEKEIQKFKSDSYWQISLNGLADKKEIIAWHKTNEFWKKEEAEKVLKNVKGKKAIVEKIKESELTQEAPFPFDLTTLQLEAYRNFGINPKESLAIAQRLYVNGLISYPRTSSQQIPDAIDIKDIFTKLLDLKYKDIVKELLKTKLIPNNGKKTDPAHPAIILTGEIPEKLEEGENKIYDLIAKRTFATFGEPAKRKSLNVDINCNKEIFVAKGILTTYPGWHKYYAPYVKLNEIELPDLEKGQEILKPKFEMFEKETQPPRRYSPASLVKELESRHLGTKCLTEDTLIRVKSEIPKDLTIKQLFEDGELLEEIETKTLISKNKHHSCFSVNESLEKEESFFELISKRSLEEDELVYEINFMDGSKIKLTNKHPVLVHDHGRIYYKPAEELSSGDKVISSFKNEDKSGKTIFSWEEFLNLCKNERLICGNFDVKTFRNDLNLSQQGLANLITVNQPDIWRYEKKKNLPLKYWKTLNLERPDFLYNPGSKIFIKNIFPLRMSSSLARVLANLVGDGSIDKEKIKNENCYDFRYHNTNLDLIKRFIKDINQIFGVFLSYKIAKPKIGNEIKYYIKVPSFIGRILAIMSKEIIDKKVSNLIYEDFYQEFIGALFDDEGHTTKSEPKLFISNTNFILLEAVKKMMTSIGIKSSLDKGQFKLYIRGKDNLCIFLEKIPIKSFKKKQRLIQHLTNFYKYGRDNVLLKEKLILNQLIKQEMTNRELSFFLKEQMSTNKYVLNKLIKKGLVSLKIVGISERPRKKLVYLANKLIGNTFYSYIGEDLISPDLITKTIDYISISDYKSEVYDLTNNELKPNFMLSNGIFVHNSTRSNIIDTLYDRQYITEQSIQATELGIRTIETLEKYSPEIIDEKLTRHFEKETDLIEQGRKNKENVIEESKNVLIKILEKFKKNELNIGGELAEANKETRDKASIVGKCPKCKVGDLRILYNKKFKSYFIACNKYPDCKTTFSMPKYALPKPGEICKECSYPKLKMIRKGKRPYDFCINPECPSRKRYLEEHNKAEENDSL